MGAVGWSTCDFFEGSYYSCVWIICLDGPTVTVAVQYNANSRRDHVMQVEILVKLLHLRMLSANTVL